jgi:hypothetical protein
LTGCIPPLKWRGLALNCSKTELKKLQMQALPPDERNEAMRQDIINFVKELKPRNENETRFKVEMKRILKIE